MNILYEGIAGQGPALIPAIALWVCGAVCLISSIAMMLSDGEPSGFGCFCIVFSILLGIAGLGANSDQRYHEVKATINDTVPWKEINEKYELVNQEGEIYVFKVRDDGSI